MRYWINAIGDTPDDIVNVRTRPTTSSSVLRSLSTLGEFVELLDEEGAWRSFKFSNNTVGWVRGDVYNIATVRDEGVNLQIPYFNQNDSGSNLFPNDCGPAATASLLAYRGVETTVNQVAQRAGLVGARFSHISDLIKAVRSYDHRAVVLSPGLGNPIKMADLIGYLNIGHPCLLLIYYNVLVPGKFYGHFIVPTGYKTVGNVLHISIHDPNRSANIWVPANKLAEAMGYVGGGLQNYPFQGVTLANKSLMDEVENHIALAKNHINTALSFINGEV